jgi:hypothetical protein
MSLLRQLAGAVLVVSALAPVTAAHAAAPGSIAGVVTDNADEPLAGIEVTVLESTSFGAVLVGTTTTNASGEYTIGNIIPDPHYKVRFRDPAGDHATEFYSDKITGSFANWVAVTEGGTNTAIDASLEPGSTLSGRLTVGSGEPVRNGSVTLWWRFADNSFATMDTYSTDADGHWSIPGVRGATYGLEFRDPATGAGEAWDDRPGILGSTPLVVPMGEDVTRIDALLGGVVTNSAAPTITGVAQVGQTLSAAAGTWQPSDTTVTYRWVVGDDTSPADDLIGSTYVPTAEDVGRTIRVQATGTRGAGWVPASAWSAATAPIAPMVVAEPVPSIPTVTNDRLPRIKGTFRVGRTVRVTTGDWTPYPQNLTFAWYAGGKLIKGAIHRRLTLKPQQLGKRLVVRVTASAPGYESLTVRTRRSDRVRR